MMITEQETEMKPTASTLMTAALIAASFVFAACAPRPPPPTVETTVIQTPTGAEIIETIQLTATVAGISYDTRQIVLLGPGGREVTYKVDKNAVNFDQIKVRDQVKATVTEKLAVFLSKDKAPASAGAGAAVVLAPKGAMPGGVVATTSEVTATVTAVDAKGPQGYTAVRRRHERHRDGGQGRRPEQSQARAIPSPRG